MVIAWIPTTAWAGDIVPLDETDWTVSSWSALQEALNAGGNIKLGADITCPDNSQENGPLVVPAKVTATLDLNGYVIDRHLSGKAANGNVITVNGTLTVTDTDPAATHGNKTWLPAGGVITGGHNSGNGGGIVVNGSLTLEKGSISRNYALNGGGVNIASNKTFIMKDGAICNNFASSYDYVTSNGSGGGVYIDAHGNFTMENGSILDNESDFSGGGVYVAQSTFTMSGGAIRGNGSSYGQGNGGGVFIHKFGTFNVSGSPVISGNHRSTTAQNVYLSNGRVIQIENGKTLDSAACIGVTTETDPAENTPIVFTDGLKANDATPGGSIDSFYADKGYKITKTDTGEAQINDTPIGWMKLQKDINVITEQSVDEEGDADNTITLTEDVSCVDPFWSPLTVSTGKPVILDLNGYVIDRGLTEPTLNGNVITVRGNLTVKDSSSENTGQITGGNNRYYSYPYTSTQSGGGVFINGGTFTLNSGTISENKADDQSDGGGVCLKGGSFNMKGGAISDNESKGDGGGVYFADNGQFIMDKGTISGNTANMNGGGVCGISGDFTMNDGSISENTANIGDSGNGGGGVYANNFTMNGGEITGNEAAEGGGVNATTFTMTYGKISQNHAVRHPDFGGSGGGVYTNKGSFNMKGGTIDQNSADARGNGVCIDVSYEEGKGFTMSGGEISANTPGDSDTDFGSVLGGGVYISNSNSELKGGEISKNRADQGGGVFITESKVTITGEHLIFRNEARNGGGVFSNATVTEGTPKETELTMNGGNIQSNKALEAGGGVFFNFGTFEMTDGVIWYNQAYGASPSAGNCGGGVYIGNGGELIMGGEDYPQIKVNESDKGGGVYVDGTLTIKGRLAIGNNQAGTWSKENADGPFDLTLTDKHDDNVYLPNGKVIKLTGPVEISGEGATPIGVTMAKPGVFTTGANFADDAAARKVFQSDDEQHEVWRTAQSQATLAKPGGDDPVEYKIIVEPPQNGTVKASAKTAPKGSAITVTTTPAEGYITDTVIVKTAAGKTVTTTAKDENTLTFTMPASDVTVSAAFVPEKVLNKDQHIQFVQGYEDGTVRPQGNITRAETATMLYRLLKPDCRDAIFTADNNFPDVEKSMWFNKAVSSMSKGEYVKGYKDGTFKGNQKITRAEFVTILVRMEGAKGTKNDFSDVSESHWAYEYILAATNAGWIEGYEDGTFRPDRDITRAEAMTILNRLLERGVDENSELKDPVLFADNADPGQWYYYEVIEASNNHTYTGHRPSENWTGNTVDYEYDIDKYERP